MGMPGALNFLDSLPTSRTAVTLLVIADVARGSLRRFDNKGEAFMTDSRCTSRSAVPTRTRHLLADADARRRL